MALTKFRLGCAIEPFSRACGNPHIPAMNISGVNRDKEFFEPSHQVGADTSKYQFVPPNYFACNLMHVGRDCVLPIAMNHTDRNKIVSPAYTVFSLKGGTPLLREYFFMMLKCPGRDREFWFHTDASVRDGMAWKDFCDIEFDLPPLSVQERYVAVYNSMVANLKANEKGLADLKLACDALIERQKAVSKCVSVMSLLREVDVRNQGRKIKEISGINIEKKFMLSKADVADAALGNYKVVSQNQFAYSSMQTGRDECIRIALQRENEPKIVSPAYFVFDVDREQVIPEWIMLWFQRREIDRKGWFLSDSSVRANLDLDRFAEIGIPLPKKDTQQQIVDVFEGYLKSQELVDRLRNRIMGMCPILVKGSLEEGKRM